MIQELTSIEAKSVNVDLLYFDFAHYGNELNEIDFHLNVGLDLHLEKVGPHAFTKSFELKRINSLELFNLEKATAEYLNSTIKEDKYKFIGGIIKFDNDTEKEFLDRLEKKLDQYNYHIANNGRISGADTYVLNSKTYKEIFSTLNKYKHAKTVINEFIDDDTIYLINNGGRDTPGYKFVHYTDENNTFYCSFIDVGFFPQYQATKLVIYRSKKSSIISNIPGANRTGIPLSECGCIIEHHIGVAGLSPRQAEEEIAQMIADYSDHREPNEENKLKKHFKFYKEYWLANSESNTHEIKINLI